MIRPMAGFAALMIGLSSCTSVIYQADISRTHDLVAPPDAGTVFVSPDAKTPLPQLGDFVADAYGWLRRWGYRQAASEDQADYVLHVDYDVYDHTVTIEEPVYESQLVDHTYYDKDGTEHWSQTWEQVQTGTQPVNYTYHQPRMVLTFDRRADQQTPLATLRIFGEDGPSYNLAKDIPHMLEIAFDRFPGTTDAERVALLDTDGLVCTATGRVFHWNLRQCRSPAAPPGILDDLPSS